jgi:hypothetical protein
MTETEEGEALKEFCEANFKGAVNSGHDRKRERERDSCCVCVSCLYLGRANSEEGNGRPIDGVLKARDVGSARLKAKQRLQFNYTKERDSKSGAKGLTGSECWTRQRIELEADQL